MEAPGIREHKEAASSRSQKEWISLGSTCSEGTQGLPYGN